MFGNENSTQHLSKTITFPLAKLSPELIENVMIFTSVPALMMLGSCCRGLRLHTRLHLHRRSRQMVEAFVRDPDQLFLLMEWTGSVISGSSALRFMLPMFDTQWLPNDLYIYVPVEASSIIQQFLRNEGFSEVNCWPSVGRPLFNSNAAITAHSDVFYEGNNDDGASPDFDNETDSDSNDYVDHNVSIQQVMKLKRDDMFIDVISSPNPLSALANFHSTGVMNYVSGCGFFSAYPMLTVLNRSLVNHIPFYPQPTPPNRIQKCFVKYNARGMSIRSSPSEWERGESGPHHEHTCYVSYACPHTVRTTLDSGCLFVPFGPNANIAGHRLTTLDDFTDRHDNSVGSAVWNIGGKPCNNTSPRVIPFIIANKIGSVYAPAITKTVIP